ncbi:MAG: methyltransferase domain-containing protein [Lachnospiraceae bacterium]|nr:methyltransferase domain-containing protein [Lachnospiraceae bacterium]
MIRDYYKNIVNGLDVKSNLLSLKDLLKDTTKGSRSKEALLLMMNGDCSVFTGLLKDEDPKIRKNSAIVLGILGIKESLEPLYEAYENETTLYNKASYVEAIKKIDYTPFLDRLKARFEELKKGDLTEETKKHVLDEMKQLKSIFGTGKPEFIGYGLQNEVVLITNRNFKNITSEALGDEDFKEFPAGLIVKTKDLRKILPIRTYEELLFIPDKAKTVTNDAAKAAKELIDGDIKDYIFNRIGIVGEKGKEKKDLRVNFRTELKTKDKVKNPDFVKKFSSEMEALSKWELSNSVSDYDVEFRLIENSNGKLNVLIKFHILKDVRFTYRRETVSAGVKPYLAATVMKLAEPYMSGNAVVLDPFCGVGTFIAEREPVVNAKMYYGIDIFGEAIEKAKKNLKSAGLMKKTELINKDFFDFEHEYRFDEIVTDMPFVTDKKTSEEIENLYEAFFKKSNELLEKKAVIVMYSRNPEFVNKHYGLSGCSIKEDFEISKKENAHLFILAR